MALHARLLTGTIPAQNRSDATTAERYARPNDGAQASMYEPRVFAGERGSHMPLDLDIHWDWRNPLNLLPAGLLLGLIVAVVALLW